MGVGVGRAGDYDDGWFVEILAEEVRRAFGGCQGVHGGGLEGARWWFWEFDGGFWNGSWKVGKLLVVCMRVGGVIFIYIGFGVRRNAVLKPRF